MIGRDAETSLLASLLAGVPGGRPFVLTVRGDAGSGRSSLLDLARDLAQDAGIRPLVARGIDGADEPAFAGLSSLLRPFASEPRRRWLPSTRRRSRGAMTLGRDAVDPLDVRLGLLRVLTAAAEANPARAAARRRRPPRPGVDGRARRSSSAASGSTRSAPSSTTGPGVGPLDAVTTAVPPPAALAPGALTDIVQAAVACAAGGRRGHRRLGGRQPAPGRRAAPARSPPTSASGAAPLPTRPGPPCWSSTGCRRSSTALPGRSVQRALVVVAADRTGRLAARSPPRSRRSVRPTGCPRRGRGGRAWS